MVEEEVEKKLGIDEILKKSIAEIDAMAKERGLNPGDYSNIEELATAIFEKPMEEKPKELEEPEKPAEKSEGEEPEGLDELLKKSREELNTLAEKNGLDPSDYHNKEEVANAILEKP